MTRELVLLAVVVTFVLGFVCGQSVDFDDKDDWRGA